MNKIIEFWKKNGTKVIGFLTGTLAAVAQAGVIPDKHLKYYMAVIGVLTFWRGFVNTELLNKDGGQ